MELTYENPKIDLLLAYLHMDPIVELGTLRPSSVGNLKAKGPNATQPQERPRKLQRNLN